MDEDDKFKPFSESEPGATGLELLLSLTLLWAEQDNIPLVKALARVTSDAANIIGITKAGHLSPGTRADLCIFDPAAQRTIERKKLLSQGKNTPFLGHTLPGTVRYTFVEGQRMYGQP